MTEPMTVAQEFKVPCANCGKGRTFTLFGKEPKRLVCMACGAETIVISSRTDTLQTITKGGNHANIEVFEYGGLIHDPGEK